MARRSALHRRSTGGLLSPRNATLLSGLREEPVEERAKCARRRRPTKYEVVVVPTEPEEGAVHAVLDWLAARAPQEDNR